MPKEIRLGVRGLWTAPNKLQAPPGTLSEANNVIIKEIGVAQSRRAHVEWSGSSWATGADASAIYGWRDGSRFIHVMNISTTLQRDDNNVAIASYTGTFTAADTRMNFADAKECLYMTTSTGVRRLDAYNGTPITAGLQKPLSLSIASAGATGAWMTDPGAVAYRAVLKFTDAKGNVYLSAPSGRGVFRNSGSGTIATTITAYIPASLSTSYYIQLYRSAQTTDASLEPSDEMNLVYERAITSAEVSALSLTITDVVPDTMRNGATAYFSPSQQGALNGNERPPKAYDICWHKQTMFYAATTSKQRLLIRLLNTTATGNAWVAATAYVIGNIVVNDSGKVYTCDTNGTSAGSGGPTGTGANITDNTTRWDYTGVATALYNGATVTIAGTAYTARTSPSTSTEFQLFTSSTQQVNVRNTAMALCNTVNTYASNTSVYAYYSSGPDDAAGLITIEERDLGASSFAATSSLAACWVPELPSSGTTISSANDEALNRIFYSKQLEPESVPLLNYIEVGSSADPIVRIVSLRDSLFVFKRKEGVFRVTGQPGAFTVMEHDRTVNIVGRKTIAPLANEIYLFSTLGVVAVSDVGVRIVSEDIRRDLRSNARGDSSTHDSAHAASDEQDGLYMLWLPVAGGALGNCFIYCPRTNAWTKSTYYASASTSSQAESNGAGHFRIFITRVGGRKVLQTDNNDDGGEDPNDASIACAMTWNPATATNPTQMKQWTRADFSVASFGDGVNNELPSTLTTAFQSDLEAPTVVETSVTVSTTIGSMFVTAPVPQSKQLATALTVSLDASVGLVKTFSCSGLILTFEEGGDNAGR